MRAEMAEFEKRGAQMLRKIEALMPRAQMYEIISSARKPQYDALFKSWGLPPEQIIDIEGIVAKRDEALVALGQEAILAGRSTPEGAVISRKMKSTKQAAAQALENILGIERARELSVWESSRAEIQDLDDLRTRGKD
jgi:hypothetical protein